MKLVVTATPTLAGGFGTVAVTERNTSTDGYSQATMSRFPGNLVTTKSDSPIYDARILPFGGTPWIACEVIHLACAAVALYLLYALLHFRAIKTMHPNATARHRKGGFWLENLCIIGIVLALMRFANNQALLFTGWMSGPRCSILLNISIAFYFIAIHPVYLFLWVRQRIFYSNRALKHLYSKTVRFLSWAAVVCFVFITIVSMILFVVDPESSASGRVCHYTITIEKQALNMTNVSESESGHISEGVRVNTMAGLLGGGIQMSFLALFLYPIMDNKLRAVRSRHMRSGSVGLITLIRRSFILAGMCILSDVAIALLVKTIHTTYPDAAFAPLAMYDMNLIINLLCIIMTFRRWRVMLFPWLYTDTCSTLFTWLGSCSRRGLPGANGSYKVAGRNAAPMRRIFSVDTLSRMDRSVASSLRLHQPQKSRPAIHLRAASVDFTCGPPVSDVPLPVRDLKAIEAKTQHMEQEPERWYTESLLANLNRSMDCDSQPNSDSISQLPHPERHRKRSSSLVFPASKVSSFKQTNAKVAASLLAKSKLWIFEGKHV